MPISVENFLAQKGAIELLCEIEPLGSRFTDLYEELEISRQTLSTRLKEGREASLLEREAVSGEQGTTHLHVLSYKGAMLRVELDRSGVVVDYQQLKQARKSFEEGVGEIQEWVAENPEQLERDSKSYSDDATDMRRILAALESEDEYSEE